MSGHARCSEEEFVELFEKFGASKTGKKLGLKIREVFARRARLENRLGRQIKAPNGRNVSHMTRHGEENPQRIQLNVENGIVLVGSDAHYWPGIVSTAHRAFVQFCKNMKPVAVIKNGDVLDGATISRYQPIGWEKRPSVKEEMETVKDRLHEIEVAAKGARRIWPLGNHDARYETRLATVAPEYAQVHGMHLKDHFPHWEACWSAWINDDVVVKHRFKSGIYAPHNNTLWSGKTIITGHLHSLKVMPISDYNGTRWGVDAGTMAEVYGSQFTDYTEDSPHNWRSGFIVLTFEQGILRWPEVVHVVDENHVDFRGKSIEV